MDIKLQKVRSKYDTQKGLLKFESIQPQPLSLLTPVSILSTGSTFKQLEQAVQYKHRHKAKQQVK